MSSRGSRTLKSLDRYAGIPLVAAAGVGRLLSRRKPPASPERIGVLCFGAIGDLILVTAVLESLKAHWPEAKLTLVVSTDNRLLLPMIDGVDETLVLSMSNVRANAATLRDQRFDLVVDTAQWARISALYAWSSRSGYSVGFRTAGQHRHAAFDRPVEHRNDRHELENFTSLVTPLGVPAKPPRLVIPDEAFDEVRAAELPERYVVFHAWAAGVRSELRQWATERWAELGGRLAADGYAVVLTGAPPESDDTQALADAMPAGVEALSVAGKLSFPGVAALLDGAAALCSVNTGIMHLGAVLGVPTAGLHGPTNPVRWGPVGPIHEAIAPESVEYGYLNLGFEYPQDPPDSMGGIAVEPVYDAMKQLIERGESDRSAPLAGATARDA